MTPPTLRDVYLLAAKKVGEGWTQGTGLASYDDGREEMCVGFAVWDAARELEFLEEEMEDVRRPLKDRLGRRIGDIARWNDAPQRLQIEVENLLREIAEEV